MNSFPFRLSRLFLNNDFIKGFNQYNNHFV